jgi:hypothetical protein
MTMKRKDIYIFLVLELVPPPPPSPLRAPQRPALLPRVGLRRPGPPSIFCRQTF